MIKAKHVMRFGERMYFELDLNEPIFFAQRGVFEFCVQHKRKNLYIFVVELGKGNDNYFVKLPIRHKNERIVWIHDSDCRDIRPLEISYCKVHKCNCVRFYSPEDTNALVCDNMGSLVAFRFKKVEK